jgi:hypothetical protein
MEAYIYVKGPHNKRFGALSGSGYGGNTIYAEHFPTDTEAQRDKLAGLVAQLRKDNPEHQFQIRNVPAKQRILSGPLAVAAISGASGLALIADGLRSIL